MATKFERTRSKARKIDVFEEAVFGLVSEMEEPLREATHFVHALSLITSHDVEDSDSIAFISVNAEMRLKILSTTLRKLFDLCRPIASKPSA